jgi:NTE family protein
MTVSPADFSHSADLIDRSHAATRKWLNERHRLTGQAAFLGLHQHEAR